MIKRLLILSILSVATLNASSMFKAEIGCKTPGNSVWTMCLKSIKLNGRLENMGNMIVKYGVSAKIIKSLPKQFNLTVTPSGSIKYYVKITNNSGKEVFYDEKSNRYSVIKVVN